MKKKIELLIFFVLLIVFVYVGYTKLAILYYNRGAKYYDRGLYEEAIGYFNKSLRINSKVAMVHYTLANAYMGKGMPDEAIKEYRKTIEVDPGYIKAYRRLAQAYLDRNMYNEAINLLKEAEGKFPADQEINKLLRAALFEYAVEYLSGGIDAFLAGDKQKAFSLLNKAAEIKPDFVYTRYTLGYFYYSEDNLDLAEAKLNEAIKIDSGYWPAYKLLGNIYFEKGNYQRAIEWYKQALALNYNDAILYNDLGLALMETERYSEAIIYLKEALKLDPNNINIRYSLASVSRDESRFQDAVSEYKNVINIQPEYPKVHNDLGDIYKQQGRDSDALNEYHKEIDNADKRLTLNENDAAALNDLAHAYNGIKEYDKARVIIRKAIAIQPDYRDAYLTLAKIQENLGEDEAALATLNKAKTMFGQVKFIDRDMLALKNKQDQLIFIYSDKVYLKNGRMFEGIIKEETDEKIILEVRIGTSQGLITIYRDNIKSIIRHNRMKDK